MATGIYSQETSISEKSTSVQFPFQGRVQGEGINVRSGNNVNYESLARLKDGTTVVVTGESYGWYRILPPEGVTFWVHQELIQDKKVLGDYVNVRSGPTLDSSVNCQLEKGTEVEILGEAGEWFQIKPPLNAQTWIAKQFVVIDRTLEIRFKKALFCGIVPPT